MVVLTRAFFTAILGPTAVSVTHTDYSKDSFNHDSSDGFRDHSSQTSVSLAMASTQPPAFPSTLTTSFLQARPLATVVVRQVPAPASTISAVTTNISSTAHSSSYTVPPIVGSVVFTVLIIVVVHIVKRKRSAKRRLQDTNVSFLHEPSPHHVRPMSQESLLPLASVHRSTVSADHTVSSDSFIETAAGLSLSTRPAVHQSLSAPQFASASLRSQMSRSIRTSLSRSSSQTLSASPCTPAAQPSETTQTSLDPSPAASQMISTPPSISTIQPSDTTQTSLASPPPIAAPVPEMLYNPPVLHTAGSTGRLDHDAFHVAVICALNLEADMVIDVLDEKFGQPINKDPKDPNSYHLGRIGRHKVVIVHLSGTGMVVAAIGSSNLVRSFRNVTTAFVVGICGIIPEHRKTGQQIRLGDCIISADVVDLDRGRQYHLQGFERDRSVRNVLGRATTGMRSFWNWLESSDISRDLEIRLSYHFEKLQSRVREEQQRKLHYPGADHDRLYQSSYPHCYDWERRADEPHSGREQSCRALGCSPEFLVRGGQLLDDTKSSREEHKVKVHFGRIGSADRVQKSGPYQDAIAEKEQVIAFEMEAAGVWDNLNTNVMVIKSGSDYSDGHKDDEWQVYAAATAACGLKAVLEKMDPSSSPSVPLPVR